MIKLNQFQRDQRRVAQSFSTAAERYDMVASLQRQVVHHLLDMDFNNRCGALLEFGCGTGYATWQLAQDNAIDTVWALDIASGMVNYAYHHRPHSKIRWLVADAHYLPFGDSTMDTVFSSLALQWCENLSQICIEVARVLKTEGCLQFATLGPDTLHELRQAWSMVDQYQHINHFIPLSQLETTLKLYFGQVRWVHKQIILRYTQMTELTRQLKILGASNHNRAAASGLMGRSRLERLQQAYEKWRDQEGLLPATYDVFYLQASHPKNIKSR
jgi:malonyl-CoA O-methyltransferase